jgi:hypothetical protein
VVERVQAWVGACVSLMCSVVVPDNVEVGIVKVVENEAREVGGKRYAGQIDRGGDVGSEAWDVGGGT